jgi:AbrB family transcriptional regulator (stage V sporulation protein T)
VSERIEEVMQERRRVLASVKAGEELLPVTTDDTGDRYTSQLVIPIISSGDSIGAVILLSKEEGTTFTETEIKVCETAAAFMGKQMET